MRSVTLTVVSLCAAILFPVLAQAQATDCDAFTPSVREGYILVLSRTHDEGPGVIVEFGTWLRLDWATAGPTWGWTPEPLEFLEGTEFTQKVRLKRGVVYRVDAIFECAQPILTKKFRFGRLEQ